LKCLLDTNAVSEPTRISPDLDYMRWFGNAEESDLFVSVITLGELRRGAALMPEGARRIRYETVHRQLMDWFADRVFAVDREIALVWGELSARLRRIGRDLPLADQLLAATALTHGLTVVTRNVRHFEPTGCKLLCPWSA
jgi:predicted nucleic acid-binding protein